MKVHEQVNIYYEDDVILSKLGIDHNLTSNNLKCLCPKPP